MSLTAFANRQHQVYKTGVREWVSQWVSESVSDKHCQWSDSGPIKIEFFPFDMIHNLHKTKTSNHDMDILYLWIFQNRRIPSILLGCPIQTVQGAWSRPGFETGFENTIEAQIGSVSVSVTPAAELFKLVGLQKQVGDATLHLWCWLTEGMWGHTWSKYNCLFWQPFRMIWYPRKKRIFKQTIIGDLVDCNSDPLRLPQFWTTWNGRCCARICF